MGSLGEAQEANLVSATLPSTLGHASSNNIKQPGIGTAPIF